MMPMKKSYFCAFQAAQPPNSVDHTVREESLYRTIRSQLRTNGVPKLLEAVCVLTGENYITGEQPVPEAVKPYSTLSLRAFGAR